MREGGKIAAGVTAALLLVAISGWLGGLIYKVNYLDRPAYTISETPALTVDIGAVRRSWPQALGSDEERTRMLAYMRNMPKEIPGLVQTSVNVAPPAPEAPLDLATRMSRADLTRGERSSRKCAACHTFEAGGAARIGPPLHGVVGRNIASVGGFAYSPAMQGVPGTWTPEELDAFLEKPAGKVPGTIMGFVGIPNQQERADLIRYLQSQS
jgi:cytochrome c